MSVPPDSMASIGILPTKVDDSDLSMSLIGRQFCRGPDDEVPSHLNFNQVCYLFHFKVARS